jgi:hypothetical protein
MEKLVLSTSLMMNPNLPFTVMRNFIILNLLFLCLACHQKEEPLTITLSGDVILDRGVADELRIYGDSMLEHSLHPFLSSDFNIINLETVLTIAHQPTKEGFAFRSDPSIAETLQKGNVTHASVANNHSYDYDSIGFAHTLSALNSKGIVNLGAKCEPTLLSKGDQSVAIVAASFTSNNDHLSINDAHELLVVVKAFAAKNPEIPLILYLHWGLEYQLAPDERQTDMAHMLIDHGADMIIGHHPHVFQGVEYYNGKPVVYSLGNFVADAYLPNTTKGMIARIRIIEQTPQLSFVPIDLSAYLPVKMSLSDQEKYMLNNMKCNDLMCYYNDGNEWFVKEMEDVDFSEESTEWLFHYENEYQIVIKPLFADGHKLTLFKNGFPQKSLLLNGELSEITIGDINNDDVQEILLGITKKVNFDQRIRKRLNIFKVENDGIQVVWLGTHFLYDLQSFSITQEGNMNYLQTLEKDTLNNKIKGIYEWDEFGFALKTMETRYENN